MRILIVGGTKIWAIENYYNNLNKVELSQR